MILHHYNTATATATTRRALLLPGGVTLRGVALQGRVASSTSATTAKSTMTTGTTPPTTRAATTTTPRQGHRHRTIPYMVL